MSSRRTAQPLLWIDGEPRAHEVLQAFEPSGGLWTGDDVARMLRRRTWQPISLLARWIVDTLVMSGAAAAELSMAPVPRQSPARTNAQRLKRTPKC